MNVAEVSTLVNGAVDDLMQELTLSNEAHDLLNLVVNVVVTRAEHPEATLREVIEECWDEEDWDSVLGWCGA